MEGGSDLEAGRGLGLQSSRVPSVRLGARPAGGAAAFPKRHRQRGPAGCAGQILRVQSRHGVHTGSMCTRLHAHLSARLHIHSTHAHTGAVLRSHGHTGPLPNPTFPNSLNPGWGGSGLSSPMSLPTGLFQPAAPGARSLPAPGYQTWPLVFCSGHSESGDSGSGFSPLPNSQRVSSREPTDVWQLWTGRP